MIAYIGALMIGWIGIAMFGPEGLADQETVMPEVLTTLFHPVLAGILLWVLLVHRRNPFVAANVGAHG